MRLLAALAALGAITAVAVSIATGTDQLPVTTGAQVQATRAADVRSCQVVTGNDHVMDMALEFGDAVTPYLGTFTATSPGVSASHGTNDVREITTAGGVSSGRVVFGWKANLPVDVVFVTSPKDDGTSETWRYTYTQHAWNGHPATGPFEDDGLAAPGATISRLLFCTVKKVRVEVSASASFTRAYTWKVENAVVARGGAAEDDPGFAKDATLALETGAQGDATWRVTTTRTGQHDTGFAVAGEVTVLNASPFVVDLDPSLTGVPGASLAGVCAKQVQGLQRGASLTCPFSASLPDGTALSPSATFLFSDRGYAFLDGTGSTGVSFTTPTTEVDRSVGWVDSIDPGTAVNRQRTGITADRDVVTYPQARLCDRDRGTESITVRLRSEDAGNALLGTDASRLTVTCTTPVRPLAVANAAAGLDWRRVTRWAIAETAVPPSHALQPGQEGTSDWVIDVTRTGVDDYVLVSGSFDVANPNGVAVSGVTVGKPFAGAAVGCAVGAGASAAAEGRSFTIPAGGTLHCTWFGERTSPDGGSATVAIASTGTPAASVTATIAWQGRTVPNRGDVNRQIVVDDDRTPQRWPATDSDDGDRRLSETFPCRNAAATNVPRILGDDPATPAVETDAVLGSATATVVTTCDTTPPADRRIDVAVSITAPAQLDLGPNGTTALDYGFVFRNNGPNAATGVVATSTAPAGVEYVSVVRQPSQGTCAIEAPAGGGTVLRCELGTLEAGQVLSGVIVDARATGPGTFTNVVAISGGGGVDTNPANDTDVARTVVVGPAGDRRMDLAVTIAAPASLSQGSNGTTAFDYTLAFRNNGPDEATDVVVASTAPPGVTYTAIAQQPAQGTCVLVLAGRGLSCTLGTLAPGQAVDGLVVAASATGTGSFTAVVTIDGRGVDTNLQNNVAQTTTTIPGPAPPPAVDPRIDTAVTVTAPGQLARGAGGVTSFTYTYTFRNNGPNAATDVVVVSAAPPGLTYTAVTRGPGQGACAILDGGKTLRCELGTLAAGQAIEGVTVDARTNQVGTFTAIVTIDGKGGPDTNPLDNTARAQTLVIAPITPPGTPRIDIEVRHGSPGVVRIARGATSATYTYRYRVRNNGPSTSTGIVIRTNAPRNVRFVRITQQPGQGTCSIVLDGARLVCSLGTMRSGSVLDLRVEARASRPAVYRTVVVGHGSGGVDANPGNNTAETRVAVIAEPAPAATPKPAPTPKPPVVQCYTARSSVRTIPAGERVAVSFTVVGSNGTRLAGARVRVVGPGIDRVLRAGGSGRVAAAIRASTGGIVTASVVGKRQCAETRIGVVVPHEPVVTG